MKGGARRASTSRPNIAGYTGLCRFGAHVSTDSGRPKVDTYRVLACKGETARELQVLGAMPTWCRAISKRSARLFRLLRQSNGRLGRSHQPADTMIADTETLRGRARRETKHFIAGWGGYPIIGTPEQIADSRVVVEDGLNGHCSNFPRYIDDMVAGLRETSIRWCSKRGCGEDGLPRKSVWLVLGTGPRSRSGSAERGCKVIAWDQNSQAVAAQGNRVPGRQPARGRRSWPTSSLDITEDKGVAGCSTAPVDFLAANVPASSSSR